MWNCSKQCNAYHNFVAVNVMFVYLSIVASRALSIKGPKLVHHYLVRCALTLLIIIMCKNSINT